MKNRRGFLKLLGIGAGAVAGAAIAAVAGKDGGNPVTPPRSPEDVIKGPKPYRGPDSVPDGDFIRKRPDIIRDVEKPLIPPLTPEQHQWIVDGQKVMHFEPYPPPPRLIINSGDVDMEKWSDVVIEPGTLIPVNAYTTGGAPNRMSTSDGTG